VYSGSSDKPKKETAELKPWTKMAAAHVQAERVLKEIAIPHVVLRMPIVYGIGDRLGLFPRILCAAVYRRLGEKVSTPHRVFL
jgi:nucleoside-diphosphate-sugar epimerase